MSSIRRLHSQEAAPVEPLAGSNSAPLSALEALGEIAAVGARAPSNPQRVEVFAQVLPPDAALPVKLELPELNSEHSRLGLEGAVEGAAGTLPSASIGPAPVSDLQSLLAVLKALAPIFRAAAVFPGHDAAPQRIAEAVGAMAVTSTELLTYLASHADVLELDTAWKHKQLQGFTASLVADRWIATVIGSGGMTVGRVPEISAEIFKPALNVILAVLHENPTLFIRGEPIGGQKLAVVQASCRIAFEIQQFVEVLATHVPQLHVDQQSLTKDVIDFLVGQVQTQAISLLDIMPDASEMGRDELFHCLTTEFSASLLLGWDKARAETLAAIKDAATSQDAARLLSQPAYQHGIAFSTFKVVGAESINRLVATARYAHAALRDKTVRKCNENV